VFRGKSKKTRELFSMFGKLKEKLKNWAKKVSKDAEPVEKEVEPIEEIGEVVKEPKKPIEKEIIVPLKLDYPSIAPDTEYLERELEKIDKEITGKKEKSVEEKITKPIKEQPAPGEKGFFKKIVSKIKKVKITEKEFEIYSDELEMLLLENNVALEVAEKMIKQLKEKIVGKELLKKEIEGEIKDAFKEIIEEILIEPFDIADKIKERMQDQSKKPYVILFCGINGTGKTTTIAKITDYLKHKKISSVLAASDTFRAASIEQLKKHGEKLKTKVIAHEYGSDPAAVGFDAIKYAEKNFINCVLIDTAGRMHTAKNLMVQIEKVAKVCNPDLKIFVGESITGNDIIEQVKSFDWAIGIDGIILTKADIDEKGGTALSVGYITKKPILYLGTGQEYNKIERFDKQKFIKILGL
jgi:fused signal recognition particle receptor